MCTRVGSQPLPAWAVAPNVVDYPLRDFVGGVNTD